MKQATSALTSFEAALDSRDSETYAHCQRAASIALILGRRLGLSQDQLLTLELIRVLRPDQENIYEKNDHR